MSSFIREDFAQCEEHNDVHLGDLIRFQPVDVTDDAGTSGFSRLNGIGIELEVEPNIGDDGRNLMWHRITSLSGTNLFKKFVSKTSLQIFLIQLR